MPNRSHRVMLTAVLIFSCTTLDVLSAAELGDPGFESLVSKTVERETMVGGWSISAGEPYASGIEVKVDKTAAHSGQVGLRLQGATAAHLAAIHQSILQLPAGIFEFKVWAKGEGVLVLKSDTLQRRGDLMKQWAEYSLTFEQAKTGPADLAILVDGKTWRGGNTQVDDATLVPASAERQAAWKGQEKARAEYGFVPEYFTAQLPQPGAIGKPAGTFQGGPVVWREKAMFFDKHYDLANAVIRNRSRGIWAPMAFRCSKPPPSVSG